MQIDSNIKISDIVGIHKVIRDVEIELALPPMSDIPSELVPHQSILSLLQIHRIPVKKFKKGFVCMGNIRMYNVACAVLGPATMIPVTIVKTKLSADAVKQLYLTELYLSPLVFQISKNDGRCLFKAWRGHPEKELHPIPRCNHHDFARILRISINALNKK